MGFHTFPVENAENLDDPNRYRYCSLEELYGAIDPAPDATVLDLGVGTGFYALDIAPHVDTLIGIDVQPAMLGYLVKRRESEPVAPVAGAIEHLPIRDGTVDVAYSTMTFHEYASSLAHERIRDVLGPGGRLVTIDWTSEGAGADGPSLDERFTLDEAVSQLQDAGYHITRTENRTESFLIVATAT